MADDRFLDAVLNLTHFHREHEKFYGQEPRADAVRLQRSARTLQALADRWSSTAPQDREFLSPFEGSEDLNDPAAIQLTGVLFLEGEGEPPELTNIKDELRRLAKGQQSTGEWLANAMNAGWDMAAALLDYPDLAHLLGERHRIIASDWQAAEMSRLAGRLLIRAVEMLDKVDFEPTSLRDELGTERAAPGYLYSAAELIGRAADLLSDGAGLVRENERRWRIFHGAVRELVDRDMSTSSTRA